MLGGGEEIRTLAPAKPTYRISNHYTNLDDDGKSGTIAVTTEPQNTPLKVAVRWLLSL